ncbi:serine/threonine-protein kinase [Azospira restricta]|uniref:non-specific serine/threonine protein kinase n=1 Tax=Azospira restricta TaxID=404405 RepID=A0A974SN31_9RHOO|nr:serine/threonine-protein kinase [Azospira restricta]QRJ62273.1 serine/threonine protein kinase [Azospira restricta]
MSFPQLGRYELVATLGRGAMGIVYQARDPLLERTLAIKTISCAGLSPAETEAFEQRFYREAKSAGRLNHPNIVTIHDVGRSGEQAYIAMEFLAGRSLRDILDSGAILAHAWIADIAAQVAEGLAFAHANQVVHRDIKPANIMVLENGIAKITDFGVAQLPSGSLTMAGTAFGSPKYMSPEQITGKTVDGRSDVFSLGVMLYELLTGSAPFAGDNLNATLYQVLNAEAPLPSQHDPRIPASFDAIVARALQKDPAARYQDAATMAAELREIAACLPAASHQPAHEIPIGNGGGDDTVAIDVIRDAGDETTQPATLPPPAAAVRRTPAPLALGALALLAALGAAAFFLSRPASSPAAEVPAATAEAASAASAAKPAPAADPVSASPAPAAAAAETPAVPANGVVRLAIAPWGEVLVDGKPAGVSPPLMELSLPPGRHLIEIRNTTFPPRKQTLDVAADSKLRIKHKFQ